MAVDEGLLAFESVSYREDMMRQPKQKPGRSKQDYGTPWALIRALEQHLRRQITWDLAASQENAKAPRFFTEDDDALKQNWSALGSGLLWLNPPFGRIAPWAKKCSEASSHVDIAMLVPASIGTKWFWEHVKDRAQILAVAPRITFDGCDDPYPKDLILCLFGPSFGVCYSCGETGLELFRWK